MRSVDQSFINRHQVCEGNLKNKSKNLNTQYAFLYQLSPPTVQKHCLITLNSRNRTVKSFQLQNNSIITYGNSSYPHGNAMTVKSILPLIIHRVGSSVALLNVEPMNCSMRVAERFCRKASITTISKNMEKCGLIAEGQGFLNDHII